MNTKQKPLLYDQHIVGRVQKCLEDNVQEAMNNISFITRQLQMKYPEYRRRKQGPFRQLVKQAYEIVSNKLLEDTSPLSSEDSSASEVEVIKVPPNNNVMKNILNRMYNKKPTLMESPADKIVSPGADAISISSDESEDSAADGPNFYEKDNYTREPMYPSGGSSEDTSISSTANDVPPSIMKKKADNEKLHSVGLKRNIEMNSEAMHPYKKSSMRALESGTQKQLIQGHKFSQNENSNSNTNSDVSNQQPLKQKLSKPSLRKFKKVVKLERSALTFEHLGGVDRLLKQLCEILIQVTSPEIFIELGVTTPNGLLLYGPSGCGKSSLAYAIAGQLNLPIISIGAAELIAGVSGESEERIREVFEQAAILSPCVLFIDEIDVISSNRQFAQKDMERRVVSQLISSIDALKEQDPNKGVVVIGATTRPDALDPALRRVGRFDYEIAIPIPNRKERKEILRYMCETLNVEANFNYDKIAELTPGYVGADISALVSRATMFAVNRNWSKQLQILQAEENVPVVDLDELEKEPENTTPGLNESTATAEGTKTATAPEVKASSVQSGVNDELVGTSAVSSTAADSVEPATVGSSDNPATNVDSGCPAIVIAPGSDEATIPAATSVVVDATENPVNNETEQQIKLIDVAVKARQPTLTEMINWLSCPPEIRDLNEVYVTLEDFCNAIKVLQPSAKREGFITVPNVCWDDIGSLHDIREELRLAILAPVKYPHKMLRLGLSVPTGVLLCGPPGCGKTLIAKAIANEAGINFISVKGPELMNMYVGESERAVRECFQRARNSAPCVIFFDEFDSLCPKRSNANDGSSGVRIVNQLLTEMDGFEERKGVYIVAATNRPDIIDPAILRPGRLDTILYVGMPNLNDRIEILTAATKNRTNPMLADDVDFHELSLKTEGYTGADLSGLIRQAAMLALRTAINLQMDMDEICVKMTHFHEALKLVRPSITEQDKKIYEKLREKYAAPRLQTANPNLIN